MAKPAASKKKKVKKNITEGLVFVNATFNNTHITVTDKQGNVITKMTSGAQGFRGSRKSTPYAAQVAADVAAREAMTHGMKTVDVQVKGPGTGRESALRGIAAAGLVVASIQDTTPIPHNGCRAPKRRRV